LPADGCGGCSRAPPPERVETTCQPPREPSAVAAFDGACVDRQNVELDEEFHRPLHFVNRRSGTCQCGTRESLREWGQPTSARRLWIGISLFAIAAATAAVEAERAAVLLDAAETELEGARSQAAEAAAHGKAVETVRDAVGPTRFEQLLEQGRTLGREAALELERPARGGARAARDLAPPQFREGARSSFTAEIPATRCIWS